MTDRARTVAGDMNSMAEHTELADNTELICPPEARSHETIHRFHVKPVDVGIDGFVDGGTLLEWIDKAAYAAAAQWCGGHCVAASVGNFHLDRPIGVGELVDVHPSLVYTGRSSMHILVTVYPATLAGPRLFKPRSAQSFSSPSTTPATHRRPPVDTGDDA